MAIVDDFGSGCRRVRLIRAANRRICGLQESESTVCKLFLWKWNKRGAWRGSETVMFVSYGSWWTEKCKLFTVLLSTSCFGQTIGDQRRGQYNKQSVIMGWLSLTRFANMVPLVRGTFRFVVSRDPNLQRNRGGITSFLRVIQPIDASVLTFFMTLSTVASHAASWCSTSTDQLGLSR